MNDQDRSAAVRRIADLKDEHWRLAGKLRMGPGPDDQARILREMQALALERAQLQVRFDIGPRSIEELERSLENELAELKSRAVVDLDRVRSLSGKGPV